MPIYMAQPEGTSVVKIGFATNLTRRLSGLQSGNHLRIRYIRVLDGTPLDEIDVQLRFTHLHIRGEFFHFDPAMLGDLGLVDLPVPVPGGGDGRAAVKSHETILRMARGIMASKARGDSGIPRHKLRADVFPEPQQQVA